MSVSTNSIAAYHDHRNTGKVGKQCQTILDRMTIGRDYSRRELAKHVGLELSSVCGRVNELLSIGLLEEKAPRKCSITGKTVCPVMKPIL